MQDKSIPTSIKESTIQGFLEHVESGSPASFRLFPLGNGCSEVDHCLHQIPVAPAVPIAHQSGRGGTFISDWLVVRCPFCGAHHAHHNTLPSRSTGHLGVREAKCTIITPMGTTPDADGMYHPAKYLIIGIDSIPTTDDIDTYFPLSDNYINAGDIPRMPRPLDRGGYVYLVRSGEYYKIGISAEPEKRIAGLQVGSPYPIETIHIQMSADYIGLERHLHAVYSDYRVTGEWFSFDDEMIGTVIDAMSAGAPGGRGTMEDAA